MKRLSSLALALSLCSCITPGHVPLPPKASLPPLPHLPGKLTEVDVGNGEKLRGLFVPPDDGESLFLHFLGSPISAGPDGQAETNNLLRELAVLGGGSLVLDMRGVGASDGVCDPRNIAADARAAWNEALRHVGGNPDRVIVRGIGLGNLEALSLLEQGVHPGQIEFLAPMGEHAARESWRREFGADPLAVGANAKLLRFDLKRVPRKDGWGWTSPFLFPNSPDENLFGEERAELLADAKELHLLVMETESDPSHPARWAYAPLGLESAIFMSHSPLNHSGYCAMHYPPEFLYPASSFPGRLIDASPQDVRTFPAERH